MFLANICLLTSIKVFTSVIKAVLSTVGFWSLITVLVPSGDRVTSSALNKSVPATTVSLLFNAIVEKLKEGFVLVGTALMPVFNMITGIVGAFAQFPMLIGAVVGGLAAMKVASGLIALRSLSIAVAEIFRGSFMAGPFGLPLAIAGVAALGAAVAGVSSMLADDMFSPPPGYGKRTLTGPEGSIALNNKDTVIAGTDLLGGNNTTNNQNATVDNTALISKVDKLIAVNERILAKSSVIEMNGNQVGQEINTSERAIQ